MSSSKQQNNQRHAGAGQWMRRSQPAFPTAIEEAMRRALVRPAKQPKRSR